MEFEEMWPNARGQGLAEELLETAITRKPRETTAVYFAAGNVEKLFRILAFPMPDDRLGVAFEELTGKREGTSHGLAETGQAPDQTLDDRIAHLLAVNRRLEEEVARSEWARDLLLQSWRLTAQEELAGAVCAHFVPLIQAVQEAGRRALSRLAPGDPMPPIGHAVKEMLGVLDRAAHSLESLRQFACIRSGALDFEKKLITFNEAVLDGIDLGKPWLLGQSAKESVDLVHNLKNTKGSCIEGEEEKIIEVIVNLIKNAAEARRGRGKIRVRTFLEEEQIILQIEDHGSGISAKDICNVFLPFWTTKPAHPGLGLAVSSGIVRLHGGSITVESVEGKGATFTVRLPCAPKSLRESQSAVTRAGEQGVP